MIVSVEKAD